MLLEMRLLRCDYQFCAYAILELVFNSSLETLLAKDIARPDKLQEKYRQYRGKEEY